MPKFEVHEIAICKYNPDYPEIEGKDVEITAVTSRVTGKSIYYLYSCECENKVYLMKAGNLRKKRPVPVLASWDDGPWIPEELENE